MKRMLLIMLIFLIVVPIRAQWDTVSTVTIGENVKRFNTQWIAPATGGVLLAGGTMFSFVPELHNISIQVRDNLQRNNHERLTFDNYIQYVPVATPVVLSLCGVKGKHDLKKMALLGGGSYLVGDALLMAGKYGFGKLRPDGSAYNSFPSGHTFTSFAGAEILRREYGEEYPWIAVAGYAVATMVGFMRIYNNRHWMSDVVAGAGLGILSVDLVYWLFDTD